MLGNLRRLRQRIKGVEKTHHLTSAMKVVASVRVRKAQNALYAMRPYSDRLMSMIQRLVRYEEEPHPLLRTKEEGKILLAVFTSDKGLCGPFNSNIIKKAELVIRNFREKGDEVDIIAIGKKGRDHFRKHDYPVVAEYTGFQPRIDYEDAVAIGEIFIDSFVAGDYKEITALYHQFYSAGRQVVIERCILPIRTFVPAEPPPVEYIYEPDKTSILHVILPMYVNVTIWRVLQESTASEHGARMVAMDMATRRCEEQIDALTLRYHKERQASITMELIDIVGTAEAVSGGI